jgi:hypothetical protein
VDIIYSSPERNSNPILYKRGAAAYQLSPAGRADKALFWSFSQIKTRENS